MELPHMDGNNNMNMMSIVLERVQKVIKHSVSLEGATIDVNEMVRT
jgi:hypothetical protein